MFAFVAWETGSEESNAAGEGWAQFGADSFPPPVDPFSPAPAPASTPTPGGSAPTQEKFDHNQEFSPFWSCNQDGESKPGKKQI